MKRKLKTMILKLVILLNQKKMINLQIIRVVVMILRKKKGDKKSSSSSRESDERKENNEIDDEKEEKVNVKIKNEKIEDDIKKR